VQLEAGATNESGVSTAGVVEEYCLSQPFGDALNCYNPPGAPSTADDATEHYFTTGKERDSESGNDYFGARYYASSMGRFLSPDPLLSSARPGNPQTWNRYAYVRNNPLGRIDPSGLYDFKNTCASGDKACNAAFAQMQTNVRSMYASTQAAYDKAVKAGDTKAAAALKKTLDGLGRKDRRTRVGKP
jgi:RHS repeat-associated protein